MLFTQYKTITEILQQLQKDLYDKGFGSRFEVEKYEFKEEVVLPNNDFPLEIFPKEIQYYIKENTDKLGLISDFMGVWNVVVNIYSDRK